MTNLSTFLTDIMSVVDKLITEFTKILGMFLTEPVLLVVFGIFICGSVIGLVTRLYRNA